MFWGKQMLISFAVGVVTGIVQEFQFGMNWSNYSRYVGDIFGAPLAMEALASFFLESTFIGVWLFGRGKISPRLHLMSIWLLAIGTALSAYFILAANSWMQHPVGYVINEATGRAELTSIFKVLTNSTTLFAFPHTILAAWTTATAVMVGVAAWHLIRKKHVDVMNASVKVLVPFMVFAALATMVVGHFNAQLMTKQQPMKMAAAEALRDTETNAPLSLLSVAPFERAPQEVNTVIEIPRLLSLLATNSFDGEVRGANDIGAEYAVKYGGKAEDYEPWMGVTYWTFRAMMGAGVLTFLLGMWALIKLRRGELVGRTTVLRLLVPATALPFIANSAGWIFTEMGRQPWVVFGLLKTADSNSPTVSTAMVATTLIGFTLLYTVLGIVGLKLFLKEAKHGPADEIEPAEAEKPDLALAY
jgi:cytochrome d ubiquinol oxidase subunit I